jgi:tetratricopeptide (TPR) repeat protein
MSEARPVPPLRVFLSYSHRDEALCERFLVHLSQLKRQGLIEPWHDRRITGGAEWAGAVDERLNSAHIIVLLVSPDFLASDYCNDVEMTHALERHEKGEALVVPVIVKPCDWETSRFAGLQALPKDGKPVVDWRTTDHGLVDVVKGLRRSIVELCGPAPVGVQVFRMAVRRRPWRWAGGLLLAVALLALYWVWLSGQRYLKQGTDLLNVGRYADALPALQGAKRLNPFSRAAGCGLEAVKLDEKRRSDLVGFEQGLNEANRQYPRCAYLKVLTGDQKYGAGDRKGAFAEYQDAARREPRLAEAYFDMGRILDLEGDPDAALEKYQKAAQLSPGTPRYHINLADLYFRREEYDRAIEEYGRIVNSPLAALEVAKIYRLQGKLDDARGREEDAVRWLKDPSVRNAEQQSAWAFDVSPTQQVQLRLADEQVCYAELELAVTTFLQGDESKAASALPAAFEKCSSRQQELKDILKWELRRLGNQTPALKPRSDAIAERFLGSGS